MTSNLLPCPFCGSIRSVEIVPQVIDHKGWEMFMPPDCTRNSYVVLCHFNKGGCGGAGGVELSESSAAAKWNRREKPLRIVGGQRDH